MNGKEKKLLKLKNKINKKKSDILICNIIQYIIQYYILEAIYLNEKKRYINRIKFQ